MTSEERESLIQQLDRSFQMMPKWAQTACKHAMRCADGVTTFREACELADDSSLEMLRDDFEDNGDLLPPTEVQ